MKHATGFSSLSFAPQKPLIVFQKYQKNMEKSIKNISKNCDLFRRKTIL